MQTPDGVDARRRVRALLGEHRLDEAASTLESLCNGTAAQPRDWLLLGQIRIRMNRPAVALDALERADAETPEQAPVINLLAHALHLLGRYEEAYARLQSQLRLTPGEPELQVSAGFIAERRDRTEDALAHYAAALACLPGHYRALLNRAALLADLDRLDEAFADYDALVGAYPGDAAAWYSRAECLIKSHRFIEAAASCDHALALDPGYVKAMLCKAVALASRGDVVPAQELFDQAWDRDRDVASRYGHPGDPLDAIPDARAVHIYQEFQRLLRAEWSSYGRFVASFSRYVESEAGSPGDLSMAFPAMYAPLAARTRAKVHIAITREIERRAGAPMPPVAPSGRDKLRVGYVSSKFRPNASFTLVRGLLAAHDRDHFEIFGYALNPEDGSVEREQSREAVDTFVDFSSMDDAEAAGRIRDAQIDILIDLSGYSDEGRPGIFARRPSPLQVQYLGHMHSLYAPWIDYRLTDAIAEPDESGQLPTEARIFLPPSLFVYDERRRPEGLPPERRALGLPEDAFVFCAFTRVEKIEPSVFSAWTTILERMPDSVLWLLDPGEPARSNLLRAAERSGIARSRLCFVGRIEQGKHIERLQSADLFLDTFSYGAHTTGVEALHANVPMLTLRGDSFATRIGASQLAAVGLPELVCSTTEDYIDRACALANDLNRLAQIRNRLTATMATDNPFASATVAAKIEAALREIWQRFRGGEGPADLWLNP